MKIHRDRSNDDAGRQRTARRFAVARRSQLAASGGLSGLPGPAFATVLASRLLRAIPATSGRESGA
jgi:hypothetical protein